MVEESSHKKGKRKDQHGNSSQKGKTAKTTPPDKSCWICGKLGRQKKNCYIHKRRMKALEEKRGNGSSNSDPNMKGTTSQGDLNFDLDLNQSYSSLNDSILNVVQYEFSWWMDLGASRHVCKERHLFKTYSKVVDGEALYIENNSSIKVQGKDKLN